MKQIITLIYTLGAAAFSVFAVVAELQPAYFWMVLIADSKNEYPIVLVGLLTFLTLLMPLLIFLIIKRMLPEKPQLAEGPGVWIIRKRQLQSALVEIPIYVNGEKQGGIAMGKIKFFPANIGNNSLIAGKGLGASEPMEFSCSLNEQLYFNLEIAQAGLLTKNELRPVAPADTVLRGK